MINKRLISRTGDAIVSEADVLINLRIDADSADQQQTALIKQLIKSATEYAEKHTGLLLITQTFELYLPTVSSFWFDLPVSPIQSMTAIAKTESGNQAISDKHYLLDTYRIVPRMRFIKDSQFTESEIVLKVIAGYADQTLIPEPIRWAIICLASFWFENGNGVAPVQLHKTPASFDALIDDYRVYR